MELFQERVKWFNAIQGGVIGDVAYFYLPYITRFMKVFPDLKIICMERNRREVIDSFMWKTRWQNRWCDHDGTRWAKDEVWDKTFPKYDMTDKAAAIGAYWDEYQKRIRDLKERYPANIRIVNMGELNTGEGRAKIFDFLEVPEENRRHMEKPKYNARKSGRRPWNKEAAFKWARRLTQTATEITRTVSPEIDFILVDQDHIRDYIPKPHRPIPFMERNGIYWGPPSDDHTAIREFHRLRESGAGYIIFAWPAFWWLTYYKGFYQYLCANYSSPMKNDRMVCFDLRN
jgi:hypothetical protein